MILDIFQNIVNYSEFRCQIVCAQINKYLSNNLNIYSLKCTITRKKYTINE